MKKITFLLIISLLLLPVNALSSSHLSPADPFNNPATKMTDELRVFLNGLNEEERLQVYIWTADIDYERIEQEALITTGLNEDAFKIKQKDLTILADLLTGLENQDEQIRAYLSQSKEERAIISRNVDRYIMEKRASAKREYQETHNDFKEKHLRDTNMLFQSQYAPMLICEVSKADVYRLEKLEQVTSISLFVSHVKLEVNYLSDYNVDNGGISGLEVSLPSINADYTRDTLGLRGNGVKIGQIEYALPQEDIPDLENARIKRLTNNPNASNSATFHASHMAVLISGKNGIVPNSELVSTSINGNAAYYREIEKLLDEGVNIINMSVYVDSNEINSITGGYENPCKWTDHIAHQLGVTFVKSAANRIIEDDHNMERRITSPGMAYTVITVGAIDNMGTSTTSDDILWDNSAYNHKEKLASKPDVVAPGCGFSFLGFDDLEGTSISAPHVTGVIAQMMEANPSLKRQAHLVKAMLLASCDRKVLGPDGKPDPREIMGDVTLKQGAGVINARHAVNMAIAQAEGTGGGYVGTVYVRLGEPPDRHRTHEHKIQLKRSVETNVVLTWLLRQNKSGETPNVVRPGMILNNLDLEIFDNSGKLVGSS